jgi:hypothetical protein
MTLATSVALLAAACGGDDDADNGAESDAVTTTVTATSPTVSEGITPPGQTLELGQPATVEFAPNPKHESRLRVTVTGLDKGKISDLKQFTLDADTKKSTVYYVHAAARNVGSGDLSKQRLTLFGKVSDELVVQPVEFGSPFPKCNYQPFPEKFRKNDRVKVCMVMLAPDHGRISEVQWRGPDEEPIAWAPS